jgi:predicted GIY-YIG superfamily endonuclease
MPHAAMDRRCGSEGCAQHASTRTYFVYILANHSRSIYIGVTNNLERRIFQHRMGLANSYTRKFRIVRLVYFQISSLLPRALSLLRATFG